MLPVGQAWGLREELGLQLTATVQSCPVVTLRAFVQEPEPAGAGKKPGWPGL